MRVLSEAEAEEEEVVTMSPMTLQQELNLSRRGCCHRHRFNAPPAPVVDEEDQTSIRFSDYNNTHKCGSSKKCSPSGVSGSYGIVKCVPLVLLGVLLCSFPAPTYGRPNGTATGLLGGAAAVQEAQPDVSMIGCLFKDAQERG